MSDDKNVPEGTETKVDTKSQQDTSAAEAEKKELIAQRDKLKAKLRDIEEKDRKAAEEKAIEEGKLKEVLSSRDAELAELRKKVETVETARQVERQKALDRVVDPGLKKFAETMPDASMILEFIDALAEKKITTHTSNDKKTAPEAPKFRNFKDWEDAVSESGGGLRPRL